MLKIYIGCAIQGLQKKEWGILYNYVSDLKYSLAALGHEVLNFKSDENREAQKGSVFEWDFKQCMECDAMIAITLHPSTGMGMEIASCLLRPHGPAFVFATAPVGTQTSRMVTECNLPGFTYQEFQDWKDIPQIFENSRILRSPFR